MKKITVNAGYKLDDIIAALQAYDGPITYTFTGKLGMSANFEVAGDIPADLYHFTKDVIKAAVGDGILMQVIEH